jgi:hypothetical protein
MQETSLDVSDALGASSDDCNDIKFFSNRIKVYDRIYLIFAATFITTFSSTALGQSVENTAQKTTIGDFVMDFGMGMFTGISFGAIRLGCG